MQVRWRRDPRQRTEKKAAPTRGTLEKDTRPKSLCCQFNKTTCSMENQDYKSQEVSDAKQEKCWSSKPRYVNRKIVLIVLSKPAKRPENRSLVRFAQLDKDQICV